MSDIVNSRDLQQEINNRLDKLQKRIPRCKESKGAYFELQDLKEWVIENQQANGDNKEQETALHLRGVSDWVAVTEKLPLVDGFYLVYIDGLTDEKALFKNNEFHVRDEALMDMEITHWMQLPKPPCS